MRRRRNARSSVVERRHGRRRATSANPKTDRFAAGFDGRDRFLANVAHRCRSVGRRLASFEGRLNENRETRRGRSIGFFQLRSQLLQQYAVARIVKTINRNNDVEALGRYVCACVRAVFTCCAFFFLPLLITHRVCRRYQLSSVITSNARRQLQLSGDGRGGGREVFARNTFVIETRSIEFANFVFFFF